MQHVLGEPEYSIVDNINSQESKKVKTKDGFHFICIHYLDKTRKGAYAFRHFQKTPESKCFHVSTEGYILISIYSGN